MQNPMNKIFPAKKINRIRKRAGKAAELPDNGPSGWSKSKVDPMSVLAVFKPLRIKDGFVLRAYQFREGGNGNGFVWAMPVDAEFPAPEDCPRLENIFLEPPKPPAALDDYMDAVDGDSSPWSYLCASLLARELAEFGAMWHGCNWSTHAIVDESPCKTVERSEEYDPDEETTPSPDEWKWLESEPAEWSPQVSQEDERVTVTFITHSGLGEEAIYRNIDVYTPGEYRFKPERQQIATGPGGFVF